MKYRLSATLLAVLAGGWLWLVTMPKPKPAARSIPGHSSNSAEALQNSAAPPVLQAGTLEVTQESNPAPAPAEIVPTKRKFAALAAAEPPEGPELASGLNPLTVLENMRAVFRQYSQRFGENPVGINREITATLNGGNPRQVVFLNPEDSMVINEHSELVDNWGTPYFFHQLSRTEMEIHSAGPDHKMWTSDDLVLK